jgi:predicted esterase
VSTLALLSWLALLAAPRAQGTWGMAYAPAQTARARPAIVYLHGMWASPEDSCPLFESAATPFGFLVCPRGNAPNGDAGAMWSGTPADAARSVHAALDAAAALAPGKLEQVRDGTLLGYSNGAYFAASLAQAEPGHWSGLVLMGMKLDLDDTALRRAGVRRVVLAAGEQDGARASMEALAAKLDAAGFPARFLSLGPGGHAFPPPGFGSVMCEAIAWVRDADPSACGGTPSARRAP